MSKTYELTASPRDRTGKGAARATRREGMIPGVIYGGNEPPVSISLGYKDLDQRINAGRFLTTIGTINIDKSSIRVIARDFQLDPVRDRPLHVDFLRVTPGSKLTLAIPVHFVNEGASPGIKRGGVLNIVRHEVDLICPVDAIPEFLTCDLTGLDINDSVHISAIELPEGVRPTITDRDFTVATIAAPAGVKEEVRAAAEAAAAAAAAGPAEGAEGAAAEGEKADAKAGDKGDKDKG